MVRSFLNTVQFDCDVKLKQKPAARSKDIEDQPEERARGLRLRARVLRLMFFLIASAVLVWTAKYGIECTYCFCMGYDEHMTIGQVVQQVKDYKVQREKDAERIYGRHK